MAQKKANAKRNNEGEKPAVAEASQPGRQPLEKQSSFPIVGVGTSAGGLEAFTQLLGALPADLRMAFVCVPHLDPYRESAMRESLRHETSMPVLKAEHGMRVRPNHVYVIPPNTELTISNGVLRFLSTRKRGEMSMPIDIFFRSLAEDPRSNAGGVILSGAASEGSVGAAAIKSQGGITFARDPNSAKYDGMPSEGESLKRQVNQLKQELAATKEELQSAKGEIQAAREELQSTNEELQTSKEELESANEELNTLNDEMQHRNQQLSLLTNDLTNLLNSVNMAIVMVGPDLRVRRFTLQAEKMLGLSSVDVGRPLSSVKFKLDFRDLEQKALDVIRDVMPQQVPVVDEKGNKYMVRITPYRTNENKIEGVVLTMPDGEAK